MSVERINSLRYRAWRRGFREADLVLGPFADSRLSAFSDSELDDFEALLETPDPVLYAWIIGRETPPANVDSPVLQRICAFARSGLSRDALT